MLCIVTGHDDPFGDWSACTSPQAKATPGEGGGQRPDGDPVAAMARPVPTSARASGGLAGLAAFGGGAGLAAFGGGAGLAAFGRRALATGSPVTRFLRRSRENGWVGAERFL
jgi:hypothetical protein